MIHASGEVRCIGGDAIDVDRVERSAHPINRGIAVVTAHDDLREHRVVVEGDLVTPAKAGVDAHVVARLRHPEAGEPPR